MAGAVGIVFGLCVLSFTAGAALMYVVMRRKEEETPVSQEVPRPAAPAPVSEEQLELRWHDPEYDEKPIHRNPVVAMPDRFSEEAEPETVLPGPAAPSTHEVASSAGQSEFRQRYLRTFEAARRRGGAADN